MTRINGNNPIINGYGIWMMTAGNNGFIYGGTIWNGGNGGRVFKVDPTTNTPTVLNGGNAIVNSDMIMSMATANNGTIYLGTAMTAGDLIMLDPKTDTFTNLGKPIAGDLAVSDLWPAPDGSVWGFAGSAVMEPHLFMIQNGTGKIIDMGVPISGNAFPGFLAIAHDGTVWGSLSGTKIFKFKPVYETIPTARLDRTVTGRIFNDDWALSANNWNPTSGNWRRAPDNTSPSEDQIVYQQTDTTNVGSFSTAGAWGPMGADPMAFSLTPAGVLEVQFKFNSPDLGVGPPPPSPKAVRFYMGYNGGGAYGLFFTEDTNQIILERDWGWWSVPYNTPLDPGYWYTVKWEVIQPTAGGSSTTTNVWLNGTKIFDQVAIPLPNRDGGAIQLSTRHYNASFDNIRLYKDTNINVNGLQAGQNVSLYAKNGTLIASAVAAGAAVTLPVDNTSFPVAGYFNITSTDGSTLVLKNLIYNDIYGGDTYSFVSPATSGFTWKYLSKGTYLSKPFDAQSKVDWTNISWHGTMPVNTNISLRTRTASTMPGLAAATWSPPYLNDTAITSVSNRWIQFEANLTTTDPTKTSELQDVTIKYKVFPNFTVGMVQSKPSLYPTDIIDYTLNYTQTGNGPAKDVIINDVLDPALAFVNSSDEAARTGAVWRFHNVLPGTINLMKIQAKVVAGTADGKTITNKATVEFTDLDGTVKGNYTTNSVQSTVHRAIAGLGLKGPASTGPGDTVVYIIPYNNTGTGIAKDLWLNLTLDNNLTITGSSAEAQRTGTSWHLSDIAANTDANVTVQAMVAPTVADNTPLQAAVKLDYIMLNGYQTAGLDSGLVTTVVQRPVLQVSKSVDKTSALPGEMLTYTIGFNNTGTADGKVVVTDILAPELVLVTSSSEANRTGGTWSFARVPAGSHNLLSLTVKINNDTMENISIINTASVNLTTLTGTALGQLDTNTVSTKIGFIPVPKMTVAMTINKATALWNETVNFTIYYNNTGQAPATWAKLKAQLPASLVFVTSDAEAFRTGNVWNFTSVAVGSHSLKITAKVLSGTPNNTILTNIVTLTYTDSRNRPGLLSQASASVKVKIPIIPPPPKDTTPPTILSKTPTSGAKEIPTNATIQITFSEPMNRSQTEAALTLSPNLSGKFTWSGNTLIFTPDTPLKAGQKYKLSFNPGAKDLAGNGLANATSWSFTVKGTTTVGKDKWAGMCLPLAIIGVIVGVIVAALLVASRRRPKPSKMEYIEERAQPSQMTKPKGSDKEVADVEPKPAEPQPETVEAPPKVEAPAVLPVQPKEPEAPKVEPGPPEQATPIKEEKIEEPPAKEPLAEPSNEDKSIDEILKKLKG
jgi:uncharacterized repeat protein (TIGR01451 family)